MKTRRMLKPVVKTIIAAVLIAIVLRAVDVGRLGAIIADSDPGWLCAAFALVLAARVVMAIRWRVILTVYDIPVPLKELTAIVFVSTSLGQLLPGVLGADLIRGQQLVSRRGRLAEVSGTIILDRLISSYSLIFIVLLGALLAPAQHVPRGLPALLAAVNVLSLLGAGTVYALRRRGVQFPLPGGTRFRGLADGSRKLFAALSDEARMRKLFLPIFSLSLLVQLVRCAIFLCVYRAVGQIVDPVWFLLFVPLVLLVMMVPVSIGGLGVREGTLAVLFATVGVEAEFSVSAGLLAHALQIVALVPGLLLFAPGRGRPLSPKDAGSEAGPQPQVEQDANQSV